MEKELISSIKSFLFRTKEKQLELKNEEFDLYFQNFFESGVEIHEYLIEYIKKKKEREHFLRLPFRVVLYIFEFTDFLDSKCFDLADFYGYFVNDRFRTVMLIFKNFEFSEYHYRRELRKIDEDYEENGGMSQIILRLMKNIPLQAKRLSVTLHLSFDDEEPITSEENSRNIQFYHHFLTFFSSLRCIEQLSFISGNGGIDQFDPLLYFVQMKGMKLNETLKDLEFEFVGYRRYFRGGDESPPYLIPSNFLPALLKKQPKDEYVRNFGQVVNERIKNIETNFPNLERLILYPYHENLRKIDSYQSYEDVSNNLGSFLNLKRIKRINSYSLLIDFENSRQLSHVDINGRSKFFKYQFRSGVDHMKNLKELTLTMDRGFKIVLAYVHQIIQFPNLEYLDLVMNPMLEDDIPQFIANNDIIPSKGGGDSMITSNLSDFRLDLCITKYLFQLTDRVEYTNLRFFEINYYGDMDEVIEDTIRIRDENFKTLESLHFFYPAGCNLPESFRFSLEQSSSLSDFLVSIDPRHDPNTTCKFSIGSNCQKLTNVRIFSNYVHKCCNMFTKEWLTEGNERGLHNLKKFVVFFFFVDFDSYLEILTKLPNLEFLQFDTCIFELESNYVKSKYSNSLSAEEKEQIKKESEERRKEEYISDLFLSNNTNNNNKIKSITFNSSGLVSHGSSNFIFEFFEVLKFCECLEKIEISVFHNLSCYIDEVQNADDLHRLICQYLVEDQCGSPKNEKPQEEEEKTKKKKKRDEEYKLRFREDMIECFHMGRRMGKYFTDHRHKKYSQQQEPQPTKNEITLFKSLKEFHYSLVCSVGDGGINDDYEVMNLDHLFSSQVINQEISSVFQKRRRKKNPKKNKKLRIKNEMKKIYEDLKKSIMDKKQDDEESEGEVDDREEIKEMNMKKRFLVGCLEIFRKCVQKNEMLFNLRKTQK